MEAVGRGMVCMCMGWREQQYSSSGITGTIGMQEATVSALKYDARPLLGSTALKVDGKSCDTQVSPKHPDFF